MITLIVSNSVIWNIQEILEHIWTPEQFNCIGMTKHVKPSL